MQGAEILKLVVANDNLVPLIDGSAMNWRHLSFCDVAAAGVSPGARRCMESRNRQQPGHQPVESELGAQLLTGENAVSS